MSLQDRLPGAYRLGAMETRTTAGKVSRPMGERPVGMLMFAGSNFCVQLAPTDRRPIGDVDRSTVLEFIGPCHHAIVTTTRRDDAPRRLVAVVTPERRRRRRGTRARCRSHRGHEAA